MIDCSSPEIEGGDKPRHQVNRGSWLRGPGFVSPLKGDFQTVYVHAHEHAHELRRYGAGEGVMRTVVKQPSEVSPADLSGETDIRGVELLPMITEKDGAPNFAMRLFRVAPEGHTPFHTHPWEHEVFVVRGSGDIVEEGGIRPLKPGTAVYVPAGEPHRFRAGPEGMDFICCVPLSQS